MRIAVMGAGAVGGFFGALLARAGNEVTLVARGEHLEAITQTGLRIKSETAGEWTTTVPATDQMSQVGEVDLILFTVKTYDNARAIPELKPLVGPQTAILSLQNGVESYQQLAAALGEEYVLPGTAYIEATIREPGLVTQKGEIVRIVFGEYGEGKTSRCQQIVSTFTEAGIETELSTDVMKALWTKFIFIVALAGPTSAARAEMDEILSYREGRDLIMSIIREAEAVGRSRGVALEEDVFEKTMSYLEGYARDLHASMHTDLEKGRPLELEALNGAVVRLGRQAKVPVPANHCIYALLKPHVSGHQRRPIQSRRD